MKHLKVTFLLLLLIPACALAQKKAKKPVIPEIFGSARFVYVQAIDGNEFDRNIYPEDRLAIADLRDAIKAWGRYTFVLDREKADLVFVVRKGRLASADVNGDIGIGDPQSGSQRVQFPGSQRQQGTGMGRQGPVAGVGVGGEVGPPDDLLQVCLVNASGKLSGPLWIHTFAHGLDAPRLLLFRQFKEELEKAYPSPPPAAPAPRSKP